MSSYSFIYLLNLNIVGDFTKMNTEKESEKSSAEIAAAPLWKYVTKLEKASVNFNFYHFFRTCLSLSRTHLACRILFLKPKKKSWYYTFWEIDTIHNFLEE